MFAQIKTIVDLVSFGLKDGWSFKTKAQRRSDVLKMLEAYFLLKDCMDEGGALIAEAGSHPVQTIQSLPQPDAEALIRRWDFALRKQGRRLSILQQLFLGQDHLVVINPDLQEQIVKAIGSKFDRVTSLHGIGAALLFYGIFPLAENHEEKARYIAVMSGSRTASISMPRIKRELKALSEALDQYQGLIEKLVTNEELVELSKVARKRTQFKEA